MKRRLKICLVALITIFCGAFCGCKANNEKNIQPVENAVANLTIFSFDGKTESKFGLPNLGHSFLAFENLTDANLTIGNYTLEPNETVCVGTWSIQAHFGVWYNVESNYIDYINKYDGRISITKQIAAEDLLNVNKFIKDNDTWNPLRNCSYFAIHLWNQVAKEGEKLSTYIIYEPSKLVKELKEFKGYEENKILLTKQNTGYFTANDYIAFDFGG